MSRIGIIAALPGELAPLVKQPHWKQTGEVYEATLPGQAQAYATSAGMGAAAATRAFSRVSEAAGEKLTAVVSYGWAGAITCGVKPPEVYALAEVVDTRTGERFRTNSPARTDGAPLRLVTIDHVTRSDEKRPLAERYQAVLVDMEAATVARLAQAHGLEFYCFKAISDGYTDVLPDFNRFLDRNGQLRLPPLIAYALLHPRYWPPLLRLARNSSAAATSLAQQLPMYLDQAGLLS